MILNHSSVFSLAEPSPFKPNGRGDATAQEVARAAGELLFDHYRELFAVFPNVEDAAKSLLAFLRANAPSQPIDDLYTLYAYGELALLTLIERRVLVPVVTTEESSADIQKLQTAVIKSGLRPAPVATLPEVAQPVGPTEAELDAAVISDWKTLSSSDVRSKMRNPDYKRRLEALMASGRI